MSMMQILGAFAKNLLEEDERSRQGMSDPKEWLKRHHHRSHIKVAPKKKNPRQEDVTRIANKVTHSIACHIDRMVKRRHDNMGYAFPLGYENSPFHNVNNPFWSLPKKKKSSICHKKTYCPSCLRSYSSGKISRKNKSMSKIKKNKKKKQEKEKKEKKIKKEAIVAMERPIIKTQSENLVQQPKTIWAKELLEEFREKVAKNEVPSNHELPKIQEKPKEQENLSKAKKNMKPKLALKKSVKKAVSKEITAG